MRRGLALAFATIMVVSMVAVPLGAAVTSVDASTAGPSGMVGTPSENIGSDLPPQTPMGEVADDLQEHGVYADAHAGSLEVVVTSPGRAETQYSGGNIQGDGPVAIVFRDDVEHEGREVAISAEVLEEVLDHRPDAVFGAHEDGDEWTREIRYEGGHAIFEIPHFSENTVTFSGGIELTGTEAASGTNYAYELDSLDGISDFEIDLEGARETEERSVSSTTEEGTLDVEPRGTSDPEEAVMTIEGVRETEERSESSMESDGGSFDLDIGGSTDAEEGSVTFQGKEVVDSQSADYGRIDEGSSESITIDGNQATEVTLELEGVGVDYYREDTDSDLDNLDHFEDTFQADGAGEATLQVRQGGGGYQWVVYVNDEKFMQEEDTHTTFEFSPDLVDGTNEIEFSDEENMWSGLDWIHLFRHDTDGVSIDVGDETVSESSTIEVGETVEKTVELPPGTHDIDVSDSPVKVSAEWGEMTLTEDPSVTIDGSTVSHSGTLEDGETVTEPISLSPGSHMADVSTEHEVDVDVEWTEVYRTENPQLDLAGESIFNSGALEEGETVSEPVDLATGESYSGEISSDGPVTARVEWVDVSETVDPTVSVNGHETEHEGTLSEGETTSLATNDAWLQEGTNDVEISMADPNGGPDPLVDFEYRHAAASASQDVDVEASSWTESFNVSHTYVSETLDADAVLTFDERVVEIDSLEVRENGGEWTTPNENDYELNGTDLHVELGDMAADTSIDVRATGHKIRTYDGDVEIVEPTVEGDDLATEVELTALNDDGRFGLRVDGTELGDRVHYASDESWSGAPAHAEVTASGTQILRADEANVGSTMTVSSSSLEVAPQTGAIEVEMEEAGDEPRFQLRPGDTVGADAVDVVYHDTLSGERYVLWSETREVEVDADRALSPVYFTTDGSSETYSILQRDASAGDAGGAGPTDAQDSLSLVLVFAGIGGVLIGTTLVGRRFGVGGRLLPITATSLTLIAIHVFAPTSPLERVAVLAYQSDVVAVAGVGLLLLALWQLDERTSGEVPLPVWLVVGGLAVVWALETLSPGVVLGGVREGVSTMAPLLIAGLVIGGGVLVRNWMRARREEAQTPDTQVTLSGFDGGDD